MQIVIKRRITPTPSTFDCGVLKPGTTLAAKLVDAFPYRSGFARVITVEHETIALPWDAFAVVNDSSLGCTGRPTRCIGGWVFARAPLDGDLLDNPIPCPCCT